MTLKKSLHRSCRTELTCSRLCSATSAAFTPVLCSSIRITSKLSDRLNVELESKRCKLCPRPRLTQQTKGIWNTRTCSRYSSLSLELLLPTCQIGVQFLVWLFVQTRERKSFDQQKEITSAHRLKARNKHLPRPLAAFLQVVPMHG